MQVKAVIFDAEGIIINTEPVWDKAQEVLFQEVGLVYDRETVKPLLAGKNLLEGSKALIKLYPAFAERFTQASLAERRFELIRDSFKMNIGFIKGFKAFYTNLKKHKVKTAVGTAMRRDLFDLVDQELKIRPLFDGKVFFANPMRQDGKQHVFEMAAQNLGVHPNECLVIEDAPNGLQAAKSAGMKTAVLLTTFKKPALFKGADLILKNFESLNKQLYFLNEDKNVCEVTSTKDMGSWRKNKTTIGIAYA